MKKLLLFLFIIFLFAQQVLISPGCANIIQPEGGLRDSLPPVLVKANPRDSATNFTGRTITLNFDEFLAPLTDVSKNLLVSPLPKNALNPQVKLRTITIKLDDTLEANTTYTINFGDAIRDVNEGNIMKNFTYIFSTGPYFDSLTLSGKVLMAETGKADSTMFVMLHKSGDDSAVVNDKPRYVTRVDAQGRFRFKNLPEGTFYVYALKDESGTYRYLNPKQLFGFADKPVNTRDKNDSLVIYTYTETEKQATPTPTINVRRPGNNAADRRLRPVISLSGGMQDLLTDLTISFDQPLKKLDTTLIRFSHDSAYVPVTGYSISLDSTKKKITLQNQWKENTLYNIIVDKEFAEDTFGRKLLKTDTLSFKTKRIADYGSLRLRFKNFDASKNPVLIFMQGETVIKSVPLTSADLSFPLFLPGDYEMRLLFDRNKNGKWDAGEFFGKHIQPELVKPIDRKITVKAGWNNEFDIAL